MSQDGQVIVGDNVHLYYDTAGAESGTFANVVPTVDNITAPDSRQVGELNQRGKSFILKFAGKRDISLSFTLAAQPGQAHFDAIRTAYLTNANIGLMPLSGPKTVDGHIGLQADWKITKFEADAPNDANPETYSVEAMLNGESDFDPVDVTTPLS